MRGVKLAHNVTLEAFVKANESAIAAYDALNALAPVPVAEVMQRQWRWHPERKHTRVWELPKAHVTLWESTTASDDGELVVLSYRFSRQRDTNDCIAKLRTASAEARKKVLDALEAHVDADGKLFVKVDKAALRDDKVLFVTRGESVMVRVNLAAYPKKWAVIARLAKKILA